MAAEVNKVEPMESEQDKEEDVYEVERIIDMRAEESDVLYRVRWKNYCSEDDTWEPEAHLEDCREVLLAFKKAVSEAKKEVEAKKTVKVLPSKSDVFDADSESDSDKDRPTDAPIKNKKKKTPEEEEETLLKEKKKDKLKEDVKPLPAPGTDDDEKEDEEKVPTSQSPPKERNTDPKKRVVESEEEDEEPVPSKKHKKEKGKEELKHNKEKGEGKERKLEISEDEVAAPLEGDLCEGPSEAQMDDTPAADGAAKSVERACLEDQLKQSKGKWEVNLQGVKDLIQDKRIGKKQDVTTKESNLPKPKSSASKSKEDVAQSDSSDGSTLLKKAKSKGPEGTALSLKAMCSSTSSSSSSSLSLSSVTAGSATKAKEDKVTRGEPLGPKDATSSTNLFEKFLLNCEVKDCAPHRPAGHPSVPEKSSSKLSKSGKLEKIPKLAKESPAQKAESEKAEKTKPSDEHTMDGGGSSSSEVAKWKAIAAALHGGALNHCETFSSTEDAIRYLYGYQGRPVFQEGATTVRISREHRDYYYHPNNLPGPVGGLSVFFSNGVADPCVLCKHASVTFDANRIKYKCKADVNANPVHISPQERSSSGLNLRRLEHLAVMHTPYFVMLFSELVQHKQYDFHAGQDAKHSIASYVFERLRDDDAGNRCSRGHDSFKFLKMWWRFQDRQSTRDLKLSIPPYFGLSTDDESTWNTRSDSFGKRKPEPLYTFLTKNCLCHGICLSSGEVVPYSEDVVPASSARMLTRGDVSTCCLSVLVPRVHLEDILHSLASVCTGRRLALSKVCQAQEQTSTDSSSAFLSVPRLDCLVLENVGHNSAVMMHIITTLDSWWQPLSSWMINTRGKPPAEPLISTRNKVFLGVLGSLRDMCLQDKRPPRCLYALGKTPRESKLAEAFFVHRQTGDVLSMLPFVSLLRIHRSSNIAADEERFRSACAQLAVGLFWAHIEHDEVVVTELTRARNYWEIHADNPVAMTESGDWVDIAYVFCRTGLVDDELWHRLGPKEVGTRDARKVPIHNVPHVWLGKKSRTIEALRRRLLALGFCEPLNVTVIEVLRGEEARAIRELQRGFVTCAPEIWGGLLSTLTPASSSARSFSPSSSPTSYSSPPFDSPPFRDMSSSCSVTEGIHGNKRSNNTSLNAAWKLFQSNGTAEHVQVSKTRKSPLRHGEPPTTSSFPSSTDTRATAEVYSDTEQSRASPSSAEVCDRFKTDLHLTTLFSYFMHYIRANPDKLIRIIRRKVTETEAADDPGVHVDDAGERDRLPRPTEVYRTNRLQTDLADWSESVLSAQAKKDRQSAPGGSDQQSRDLTEAIAAMEPTGANADNERVACEDKRILEENKRWKTSGVTAVSLETFGYRPYKKMAYVTSDRVAIATITQVKLQTLPVIQEPLHNPTLGLAEPRRCRLWARPTDSEPVVTVERVDPKDRTLNWAIGVESGLAGQPSELFSPWIQNRKRIPCTRISCKVETQTYKTVDLSAPPNDGFRHVELTIGDFPTSTRADTAKTLLVIKSRQTFYLGPVATVQNVNGLLLQKINAKSTQLIQDILHWHTSLQVHPFVPRTFALHLVKTPFPDESAVGMFVGEAAGNWNLGCSRGMCVMEEMEKFTLAYHILRCLLRVQILCFRVLGFTLKCIQPARIWRWRTGFRADFISCLADTMYMLHKDDPPWGGAAGLATVHYTMQQLGLFRYLPGCVKDLLISSATVFQKDVRRRNLVRGCDYELSHNSLDTDDGHHLYTAYNMCKFTECEISEQSSLDVLLGPDRYQHINLQTMGFVVQPYGPFSIQIHHQFFSWNQAVIVEPVLNGLPHLAMVTNVLSSRQRGAVRKVSNAGVHNRKRGSIAAVGAWLPTPSARDPVEHATMQRSLYCSESEPAAIATGRPVRDAHRATHRGTLHPEAPGPAALCQEAEAHPGQREDSDRKPRCVVRQTAGEAQAAHRRR